MKMLYFMVLVLSILIVIGCEDSGKEASPADTIETTESPGNDDVTSDTDPIEARIDSLFPRPPAYGEVNHEQVRRMLTENEDGPFYMVNLVRFRETAEYPDGIDSHLTGREANDRYNALPFLLEIGAKPVFVADIERSMIGAEGEWDQVAIARYPSRAAFFGMIERDDYREIAVHKGAGVEASIVMVTEPIDLDISTTIESLDPSDVPFPPTDDDPPFSMVHVLDFHDIAQYEDGRQTDLTGREAIMLYSQNAGSVAAPLGIRADMWLEVEGVLIGDGREWDEVRINSFPSHATFAELTSNPVWASGVEHRVAALNDTYALMTLPVIDFLDME